MSIASEISQLNTNKTNIKAAIEAKNPSTMPGLDMSQWAGAIASIQSGGLPGYNLIDGLESGQITYYMSDGTIVTGNGNKSGVVAVRFPKLNTAYIYEGSSQVAERSGGSGEFAGWIHWILKADTRIENESSCLLKGTTIELSNGSHKNVEDITFNDELLVWDFDKAYLTTTKPIWIKKVETIDYWFLNKYKSGKVLKTTGKSETGWGHRTFDLNKNKFIYTTESVSDNIFTLDGIDTHISCERIEEPCEYYNIITERHFNLFANGILTSCSLNNLYPIKDMKYVKDNRALRNISDYDNIPQKWFDGLRLSENNTNIDKLNKYVKNLMEKNYV